MERIVIISENPAHHDTLFRVLKPVFPHCEIHIISSTKTDLTKISLETYPRSPSLRSSSQDEVTVKGADTHGSELDYHHAQRVGTVHA